MKLRLRRVIFLMPFVFLYQAAMAEEQEAQILQGLAGNVGASFEAGRLGNGAMGLDDRTMTAVSLEGLLGYRFNQKWTFGVDLNYRFQQQQTKLEDVNGTNLAGRGWLLGLGAQYHFNDEWALQGAIDAVGSYEFAQKTASSQDDKLINPLSIRLKAQYFLNPNLSADGSMNYIQWSTFHVGGTDRSEATKQWMLGVGLSYHFGGRSPATKSEPAPPPAPEPKPAPVEEVSKNEIDLKDNIFKPYSSKVSPQLKKQLKELAEALKKNPDEKVVVKGYTDTSGHLDKNNKLSQERAQAVKKTLIQFGVQSDRITTEGLGPANPAFDNATPEGRSRNRRVEIQKGN